MMTVPEYFGCKAFDDRVMKARLSQPVYESMRTTMAEGEMLNWSVANAVAQAL